MKEFLDSVSLEEKARVEQEIANAQQEVLNKAPYMIYIGYFHDIKEAKAHSEKLKKHMGIDNSIKSI